MITYHFVITTAFGAHQISWDGTYAARPGATRPTAYDEIVKATRQRAVENGIPAIGGATLFFDLAPNEIGEYLETTGAE